MVLLTVEVGVSLTLSPALGTLFLLFDCLSNLDMRVCVYSYCILLCCVLSTSLGSLLFSEEESRSSGSWGESRWGIGRSGGRGAVVRVCYMREEYIKRKNESDVEISIVVNLDLT